MFLAIVKNTKLHHFVRFNCMQVGQSVVGRLLLRWLHCSLLLGTPAPLPAWVSGLYR